jgi:diguanylate cyclase (GGDEF)-like protein/PAS domain S-box-containing protein
VTVTLILAISVSLQLAAAFLALRLIRTTGGLMAWLALSGAILLMTVRRAISLYNAIVYYPEQQPLLQTELVALLISVLMLLAVYAIRPLFESIRRSEQILAAATKRSQTVLETSPDGFWVTDAHGILQQVNKAYCDMVGRSAQELLGTPVFSAAANPGGAESLGAFLPRVIEEGNGRIDIRHRHADGRLLDMELHAKYAEIGDERFIFTFARDVTARKHAEAALFEEKERAHVTLESIGDGVLTTDVDGRVQYLNPVAEHLCGCGEATAVNQPLAKVLKLVDATKGQPIADPVKQCLRSQQSIRLSKDLSLESRDGENVYDVELNVSPIHDRNGTTIGTVLVLRDVTELRVMARELSYQATHDSLTGLINRREFENRLSDALLGAHRRSRIHALCYLDLDQFKVVNDTCGHVAGDELLKQISQMLLHCVRDSDTVARLGGDEFGVLIHECTVDQAALVAEKLRTALKGLHFAWEGNIFDAGASIGLVPINGESGTLTDVLSAADSACYVAKESGRNRVHIFEQDDTAVAQRHGQMQWIQKIQRAFDENRFRLAYQIIRPTQAGHAKRDRAELLLRFIDEDGQVVAPGVFLPSAERYHLMPTIDRWVVRSAFQAIATNCCGLTDKVEAVAINLSGQTLADGAFLEYVLGLLEEAAIQPRQVCFEITETALISNLANARHMIAVLREEGIRFSLDDFGSGLSSFSYLKSLPVDHLKIDGSFVRNMLHDPNDYNMVVSINQIGHVMGIKTIAEFVEDEETWQALVRLGVDYAQGYWISRPEILEPEPGATGKNN